MDFLTIVNEQIDNVFDELIAAKRAAKKAEALAEIQNAAYHKGRAEELEKWWRSLEEMLTKIIERKEAELKKRRAEIERMTDEEE